MENKSRKELLERIRSDFKKLGVDTSEFNDEELEEKVFQITEILCSPGGKDDMDKVKDALKKEE